MSENYRFPGDFSLESLELIDKAGAPINILRLSVRVFYSSRLISTFHENRTSSQ